MITDTPEPVTDSLFATLDFKRIGAELRAHSSYEKNGKNARTLVRGSEMTLTLVTLKTGKELKEHHSPGPATAIVLEGEIDFKSSNPSKTIPLRTHQSAVFSSKIPHSVVAKKDTTLLVVFGQKDG